MRCTSIVDKMRENRIRLFGLIKRREKSAYVRAVI